ncbi:MAG: class I SAM-dependent methyltransferase, partial [Endomicrobium sp.]|nr:class I SAM-dependent methyltransferase [Endomicrobium sp.]
SLYLEIGPCHGIYFVDAAQSEKFEKCIGIDISETAVRQTQAYIDYVFKDSKRNCEIICGDFFDYAPVNKPNMIAMGAVLEHVENPLAFLKKIYDTADDNAIIFISTAINAPQLDHIYLFNNIDEIVDLFRKAKLKVFDMVASTSNFVSIEKALKKKSSIIPAFILKKDK